ncbi:hypothetical protein PC113_g4663 [Phytophthora cactorum]|uniref:EGF-like domain-containing protein n=1 Tax=Phytophthora cactorum TaxID=29920 RepID=A0A8T0ZML4_9STRA|nr:hypothetical protein PC111_g5337 [Phytophthora cactorum]KAG2864358.1 hypothetical protein PC113_g4663 [Phytophthora cactorum]KAG3180962.1 hypothetical protein C6341_g6666 [Phytophthora cactorum]KAG3195929.1 hypothetical protein PC128_g8040 [Phytophthora cactorum]
MRALAQLSALAAALATTTLAYQQENAWSSTNTSPLGTTDELLALTDGAECAVPESFALTITMGKCFSPTEIAEVRNSLNWPVSNAKFKSKTLKTVSCSSTNESPYAMPSPLLRPPQIDIVMGKKKSTVRGAVIIRVCSSLDCGVLPTDIVVSSAAKAHSAISQTVRDMVDCPTPTSSVSCREHGKCHCKCPEGQHIVNGACSQCPSRMSFVGGTCICDGGKVEASPGVCACRGDQSFIDGKCQCPGDQSLVDNKCQCSGDQSLVDGKCQCPGDQSLVDGKCQCPGDQSLVDGKCQCAGDQLFVDGKCQCSGDQAFADGKCRCAGNQLFIDGRCQCAGDQSFIDGKCQCPGDQSLVDNKCQCPGDQSLVDGKCQCPGDQSLVDGKCQCPGDQSLVDGKCQCAGDQLFVDGKCQCSGDQAFADGKCRCAGNQLVVDGRCECPTGMSMVQGLCSCPYGEHVEGGVCVPSCYWKANNVGLNCLWSDPEKAALKLKDDCKVDAPVPKDSYVNDGRKNQNDAAKIDPVISITATREGDTTGVTHKAPWIDYALTPQNLENKVTFGSFGVFDLSLTATDYRYEATCRGCVAVVDNYPPTAKDQCKTSDNQATKVLYSTSNLDDAIAEEAKFKAFYSPDNVINNGAYDSTTGANERCDESSASMQDFFETSASPLRSVESTCFDSDFVTELLDSTPKESPFLLSDVEMNALQCTRCCSKSLSLQEYYYAYDCSTKAAYTEKKTAISDSCSFGHCLQMSSNSLVTSTADITPEADAKTTKTVAGLPSPITPGIKDIHRSITCSSFDGGCSYTSKLGELFKHSSKWGVSVPDSYNVDDYVFWRYSVGTESWNSWDDSATLTFTEAQTDVFVEAWTHCGQVLHDTFTVFLHPHSSRPKCAGFNAMWSELTAYPRTVDSHMCAYPGSDFVLMQFAYDSEPNLPHDANTVQGKFTDVKCYVKLAASGSLASVTHGEVPLAITPDSNGRIQVSKQLALELVHDPETVENTDVQVECDFTLTHYDAATTETDTCLHSFTITDCDHTEIETYGAEAVCKAGECLSPSGTPGPFETCGGSVFTTENYVTQEKTLSGECCKECSNTLACTALAESNPGDGVQRCEPASTGDLLVMALRGEGEWKDAATPSMVLMFMGVTALVAVVALVVVKRRNAGAARATEEYDAYYPLLE